MVPLFNLWFALGCAGPRATVIGEADRATQHLSSSAAPEPTAAALDPGLAFLWRNGTRSADGGAPQDGVEVVVRGWARNASAGAAVCRESVLVYCLDRPRWETGLQGSFVTVRGTLTRRKRVSREASDEAEAIAAIESSGAGIFELADCAVTAGATNDDVPPDELAALQTSGGLSFPGGVAAVGEEVFVEGPASHFDRGLVIRGLAVWLELRCGDGWAAVPEGRFLQAKGVLQYQPSPFLPGAWPCDGLCVPSSGNWGRFYIGTCEADFAP